MPERVGLAVLLVAMVVTSWLGPSSEFTESYDEWQKEWSRPEVIGMFALSATFVVGWVAMLLLPLDPNPNPNPNPLTLTSPRRPWTISRSSGWTSAPTASARPGWQ